MSDDTTRNRLDRLTPDMGWKGLALLGAIMITGGVLAFLNPFAASLAAEAIARSGERVAQGEPGGVPEVAAAQAFVQGGVGGWHVPKVPRS
ncbi:MAG: hypothetical protein ABR510_13785, partial [Trueperaceae bacterium]